MSTGVMLFAAAGFALSHTLCWISGRNHARRVAGERIDAAAACPATPVQETTIASSTPVAQGAYIACLQHAANLQKDALAYLSYSNFVHGKLQAHLNHTATLGKWSILTSDEQPWINNVPLRTTFTKELRNNGFCVSFRYNCGKEPNVLYISVFNNNDVWQVGNPVPGRKGEA